MSDHVTPADLARFSPGDKVRVTFDGVVTPGRVKGPGWTLPTLGVNLGDFTQYDVNLPDAAIVSIGRVRPELPSGWEWDGEEAVWSEGGVVKGKITSTTISLYPGPLWHPSEIAKVIEAVRNA